MQEREKERDDNDMMAVGSPKRKTEREGDRWRERREKKRKRGCRLGEPRGSPLLGAFSSFFSEGKVPFHPSFSGVKPHCSS